MQVVADPLGHLQAEGHLRLGRVGAFEKVDARRGPVGDGADKGRSASRSAREQRLQRRHRLARLEAVHERVVGVRVVADVLGHLAVQRDGLLEMRREGGEVAVRAGTAQMSCPTEPSSARARRARQGCGGGSRWPRGPARRSCARPTWALCCTSASADSRSPQRLVRHDHVAGDHRQRGDLLGARLGPARGHLGARVPGEHRLGVQHVVDLPHAGEKCCIAHVGRSPSAVGRPIRAAYILIVDNRQSDYRW